MSVEHDPEHSAEASPAAETGPPAQPPAEPHAETQAERPQSENMLPQRTRRPTGVERLLVRLVATAGIVAIGVAIAAIMVSSKSHGWLVGLVVSIVSVVLAAILWSSRQL
jgi:hypothetical protein